MSGKIKIIIAVVMLLTTVCMITAPATSSENTESPGTITVPYFGGLLYDSGITEGNFKAECVDPETGNGLGLSIRYVDESIAERVRAGEKVNNQDLEWRGAGDAVNRYVYIDRVQPIGLVNGDMFNLNLYKTNSSGWEGKDPVSFKTVNVTTTFSNCEGIESNITIDSVGMNGTVFKNSIEGVTWIGVHASKSIRDDGNNGLNNMTVDYKTGNVSFKTHSPAGTYDVYLSIAHVPNGETAKHTCVHKVIVTVAGSAGCGHEESEIFTDCPGTFTIKEGEKSVVFPIKGTYNDITYGLESPVNGLTISSTGTLTFSESGNYEFTVIAQHCGIQTESKIVYVIVSDANESGTECGHGKAISKNVEIELGSNEWIPVFDNIKIDTILGTPELNIELNSEKTAFRIIGNPNTGTYTDAVHMTVICPECGKAIDVKYTITIVDGKTCAHGKDMNVTFILGSDDWIDVTYAGGTGYVIKDTSKLNIVLNSDGNGFRIIGNPSPGEYKNAVHVKSTCSECGKDVNVKITITIVDDGTPSEKPERPPQNMNRPTNGCDIKAR